MQTTTFRASLLVTLAVLIPSFLALVSWVPRFEDEDTSILHGQFFVDALFWRDAISVDGYGTVDALGSIGLPVTLPAGMVHRWTGDVLYPRLTMLLWSMLFWWAILNLFRVMAARLEVREQPGSRWQWVFGGAAVVWAVQAYPFLWQNQICVLGEVPGAAVLLFAVAQVLQRRWWVSAVLVGLALVIKPYYLAFVPVVLLVRALDASTGRMRQVGLLLLGSLVPLALVQALRWYVLGHEGYLMVTQSYLHLYEEFVTSDNEVRALELPGFTWRVQAAWWIGACGGMITSAHLLLRRKATTGRRDTLGTTLGILGLVVAAGSAHWLLFAENQHWRRTLPFVIPGFVILVSYFALWLLSQDGSRRVWIAQAAALVLVLFALTYLSVFSVRRHGTPMNWQQRQGVELSPFRVHPRR